MVGRGFYALPTRTDGKHLPATCVARSVGHAQGKVNRNQSHSIPEICAALGISRATLYRYVKKAEPPTE
ncbi:MAG: helix-turn-helix domain-containing protein [Ktedonobacteraceae bacterium]|nr:helix-turn-helix domain-containing protein [Ktedonobacteraceae bacterium]